MSRRGANRKGYIWTVVCALSLLSALIWQSTSSFDGAAAHVVPTGYESIPVALESAVAAAAALPPSLPSEAAATKFAAALAFVEPQTSGKLASPGINILPLAAFSAQAPMVVQDIAVIAPQPLAEHAEPKASLLSARQDMHLTAASEVAASMSTSSDRSYVPASVGCEFVERLDFYDEDKNALLQSRDAASEKECCKRCIGHKRCNIAIYNGAKCFLKIISRSSEPLKRKRLSPRTKRLVACIIPGRTPPYEQWIREDREECARSRRPPRPNAMQHHWVTGLPPVAWRALKSHARQQVQGSLVSSHQSRIEKKLSRLKRAPFVHINTSFPLGVALPPVAASLTKELFVGEWPMLREDLRRAAQGGNAPELLTLKVCLGTNDSAAMSGTMFRELYDIGFWVLNRSHVDADCAGFVLLNAGHSTRSSLPASVWRECEEVARRVREKLLQGLAAHGGGDDDVFEDVDIMLPLAPPIIDHELQRGTGQGIKNLVGMSPELSMGRKCVVYGIGISSNSAFETKMAELGCETHAFDCTISPETDSVFRKPFTFHEWCIGEQAGHGELGTRYAAGFIEGLSNKTLVFKSLAQTMRELGHTELNVLKFDIEGFEWGLFERDIFTSSLRIEQIAFELHTVGVERRFVPRSLVKCRDRAAVDDLFIKLFDLGYRVVSKEINNHSPACAEFVVINVSL